MARNAASISCNGATACLSHAATEYGRKMSPIPGRNCGHKVVRRQQSYDENYRGGGGGGPVIFGGGGFGSGGGGFSGGSFGGGMGGGRRSRFTVLSGTAGRLL